MPDDRLGEGGVGGDDIVAGSSGTWLAAVRMSAGLELGMRIPYETWWPRRWCPTGCTGPNLVWRLVHDGEQLPPLRVTGLAAEAAFFAVLSVPPLVFALLGRSAT